MQYAPVPQNPPPIQTGPLYYQGGAYPPPNPNNNYTEPNYPNPNTSYPDPNYPQNGYPEEDDVFVATSSRAGSVSGGHIQDPMYDTVDTDNLKQYQRSEEGVIIPEPVRPTTNKKNKQHNGPETPAEKARRERQEKKKRQKEMQSASSEAGLQ